MCAKINGGDVSDPLQNDLDGGGNSLTNVGSVDTDDSVTVTTGEAGGTTLHYGSDQDRSNAGAKSVALGIGARANGDDGSGGTIGDHVAVGYQAGQNNTGGRSTMTGSRAGQNNAGGDSTMIGNQAGRDNTGGRSTMTGFRAGQDNSANYSTMTGYQAGQSNTGGRSTIIGYQAGRNNSSNHSTMMGNQAGRGDGLADPTTMGDDNIGIGVSAIRNNQASGLIAIGQDAGVNAQTDDQLIITQRDGTRRMVMDLTTGDLKITGTLTESATL